MATFYMEIPDEVLEETLLALCEREGGYKTTITDEFGVITKNTLTLAEQARGAVIKYIKQSVINRRERIAMEALSVSADDIIIE